MDLSKLTVEQLSNLETEIAAERAKRAGTGLEFWNGSDGDIARCPSGGSILEVQDAIDQYSFKSWYPTPETALAMLDRIASSRGRSRAEGACYVNLTAPGCFESYAQVKPGA